MVRDKKQTHTCLYLDINHRQSLFGAAIVSGHSVHRLRNVVQNQIQIHFIFLLNKQKEQVTYAHINLQYIIEYIHYSFNESVD